MEFNKSCVGIISYVNVIISHVKEEVVIFKWKPNGSSSSLNTSSTKACKYIDNLIYFIVRRI